MDAIKKIEVAGDFKSDKIYSLYKTSSTEINLEILSLFQKYESSLDFFSYYTKNDIKNLLNIFELELQKNYDEYFSSFKTDTEQYISCISHIILSIKLLAFLFLNGILIISIINLLIKLFIVILFIF